MSVEKSVLRTPLSIKPLNINNKMNMKEDLTKVKTEDHNPLKHAFHFCDI